MGNGAAILRLQNSFVIAQHDVTSTKEWCLQAVTDTRRALRHAEQPGVCVVCQKKPTELVLLPCEHFCVCEQCNEDGRLEGDVNATTEFERHDIRGTWDDYCPVCNMIVDGVIRVGPNPPM